MREEIQNIKNQAIGRIMNAKSITDLDDVRRSALGKNGQLKNATKEMKSLATQERKSLGILINETKKIIEVEIARKKREFNVLSRVWFDPTLPGNKPQAGSVHALTKAIKEIEDIFVSIGFRRERYPEIEWDWYAFTSLNFPQDHPAHDNFETFFVDKKPHPQKGRVVLTPHTSSGQVREMQKGELPIRMINISKCYRRQLDTSHTPMFHQFEGLVVNKGINITHLKGTLDYFAKNFYGDFAKTRIRPHNFLFTEPSFEIDITCSFCEGRGCKLCKEGWLEIGGSGMVHPNVLKNGGIDPKKYSGFAFGWGVERAYMMKKGLGIGDLRTLYSTNIEILKQF